MDDKRYRVELTNQGFWPCKVVAGDGSRALYIGTSKKCEQVAALLEEAFLDGKSVSVTKVTYAPGHADWCHASHPHRLASCNCRPRFIR